MPDDDLFDFDKQMAESGPAIKEPTNEEPVVTKEDEVLINDEDDDDSELVLESKKETKVEEKPKEKPKKEGKPSKEDSARILREQRDEARKRLESYGDVQPEIVQSVASWLKERFPNTVPTQDEILGEFELIKTRDEELSSLKEEISKREQVIRELDIRGSAEYKEQFVTPYQEAASYLFTEIAHLDDDGKTRAPNATHQFYESLLKNSGAIKPEDVKRELTKFAKAYKEETQEDYIPPSVSTVMSALKAVNDRRGKMQEAYNSWETQKNESAMKRQKEQHEMSEQDRAQAKRLRKAQATKALNTFDYTTLIESEVFKDSQEFSKIFNEEYKSTEKVFEDPNTAPPYSDLLQRGVKARSFDILFEKYQKLNEKYKTLLSENNSVSRGENKGDNHAKDDTNWHGGELD